jgi:glucosamine--fructose-6-phosphate aminotransferase (isomerizing)
VGVVCGIVGYVGKEERCLEVLMEGLRQLEYRGYDSAGLALQLDGRIETIKQAGRLGRLAEALGQRNGELSEAWAGVGHTRWATHGPPNEANAHPQIGAGVAVVHNGIIENFAKLKEELIERGVSFTSDTDTEVIAHLLAEGMEDGAPLREALAAALLRLEGSFAVAALSAREPGKVVGARHQSPLVVGLGEDENYLASAVGALI